MGQESGYSLTGSSSLLQVAHKAAIKLLLRAGISSKAWLEKHPSSHGCWQVSVPCEWRAPVHHCRPEITLSCLPCVISSRWVRSESLGRQKSWSHAAKGMQVTSHQLFHNLCVTNKLTGPAHTQGEDFTRVWIPWNGYHKCHLRSCQSYWSRAERIGGETKGKETIKEAITYWGKSIRFKEKEVIIGRIGILKGIFSGKINSTQDLPMSSEC